MPFLPPNEQCQSTEGTNASTPPLSFFTGRIPFLPPNQQHQSTEGKPRRQQQSSQEVAQVRIIINLSTTEEQLYCNILTASKAILYYDVVYCLVSNSDITCPEKPHDEKSVTHPIWHPSENYLTTICNTKESVKWLFSPPGCWKQASRIHVLLLFLLFNDACQTNYLKIYQTDLCQIFGVVRTMAVVNQSEISFLVP